MYEQIANAAHSFQLDILGGFHPDAEDNTLQGIQTVLLMGPKAPDFWPHFVETPEYKNDTPNPVDCWSVRVLTALGTTFNAHPYFPFTGPPYHPFFQWAERSARCHQSPINLLVHDTAGLFVSFRGALGFSQKIALPPPPANPCLSCTDTPCVTACPVDAFADGAYNVPACREVIGDSDPSACLSRGCAARRACPASQAYGRLEAQSAYHMRVFLENGP